jgi:lipopolysaccharide/colanic/teichoic acid biosynthesis glycosyltransferase
LLAATVTLEGVRKLESAHDAIAVADHRGRVRWERHLLLAAGDGIAVAVAFLMAFNLRSAEIRHEFFAIPGGAMLMVVLTWFVCAQTIDGYRLVNTANTRASFDTVGSILILSFISLLGVFFVLPYRITRPTVLLWVPLAAAMVLTWRTAYQTLFATAIFAGNLLVIAERKLFDRVWAEASATLPNLYRVLAIMEPRRADVTACVVEITARQRSTEVIVGGDDVSRELFRGLVTCCEQGVRVRTLADLYEDMTGRMLLDQLGCEWLMSLPLRSESSQLYQVLKRGIDLIAGIAGMIVLAALYPFVAIAIRLNDGGAVLYRQTRVGKHGRLFDIVKFRTMSPDQVASERQTDASDPRITMIGRVLRRLHLDELPQAINIFRGDMSLVGPRPEQPWHSALMRRKIDFYNLRLSVRPGLTGWAQVNFGYGAGVEGAKKTLSYDF